MNELTINDINNHRNQLRADLAQAINKFRSATGLSPVIEIDNVLAAGICGDLSGYEIKVKVSL
jgi:hypothetical protein